MKRRELLGLIGAGAVVGLAGCSSTGGTSGVGEDDFMIDGKRALDIKTIYFDYDSYVIRPEYRRVLSAHARKLDGSGRTCRGRCTSVRHGTSCRHVVVSATGYYHSGR